MKYFLYFMSITCWNHNKFFICVISLERNLNCEVCNEAKCEVCNQKWLSNKKTMDTHISAIKIHISFCFEIFLCIFYNGFYPMFHEVSATSSALIFVSVYDIFACHLCLCTNMCYVVTRIYIYKVLVLNLLF